MRHPSVQILAVCSPFLWSITTPHAHSVALWKEYDLFHTMTDERGVELKLPILDHETFVVRKRPYQHIPLGHIRYAPEAQSHVLSVFLVAHLAEHGALCNIFLSSRLRAQVYFVLLLRNSSHVAIDLANICAAFAPRSPSSTINANLATSP